MCKNKGSLLLRTGLGLLVGLGGLCDLGMTQINICQHLKDLVTNCYFLRLKNLLLVSDASHIQIFMCYANLKLLDHIRLILVGKYCLVGKFCLSLEKVVYACFVGKFFLGFLMVLQVLRQA